MIYQCRPPRAALAFIVCVLTCAALAAQKVEVKVNQDKTADFAAIKTYAWLPPPPMPLTVAPDAVSDPTLTQEVLGPHIMAAADRQLASRGFTRVEGDAADVQIVYYVALKTGFNDSYLGEYYSYMTGWGTPPVAAATTSFTVHQEGSVVIDVVAPKSHKAIWRATALTRVRQENTLEKRIERLTAAVNEMFERFPVRPAKR